MKALRALESEAESLLRGRGRNDARAFARLIGEVNPTARGLDSRETDRRYALKSRLQSACIVRFGDDLVFVSEADDSIVAVDYPAIGLHFGHARLDTLEDDARSLVRRALDRGLSPDVTSKRAETPIASERPSSTGTLVVSARSALDEWDFEAAIATLERALRTDEKSEALPLLLEVFVERIADDPRAVALATDHETLVQREPTSRRLAAMAHARLGALEAAARLLGANLDRADADAIAAIARGHIDAGDEASARTWMAELIRVDASSPHRVDLEERIRALSRGHAAAKRAELEAAIERRDDATVERLAKEVLGLDPSSTVARAALRALADRKEEARRRAARDSFERALGLEDPSAARRAWRMLADRSPDDESRVVALEMATAKRAHRRRVSELVAAFEAGSATALEEFTECDDDVRDGVRRRLPNDPALSWFASFPSGRADVLATIRFAVDVEQAVEHGGPLPVPTAEIAQRLRSVTRGRALLERVERLRVEAEVGHADAALEALAHADAEGDASTAARIEALARMRLDESQRARLDALRVRHDEARKIGDLAAKIERARSDGYPFEGTFHAFLASLSTVLPESEARAFWTRAGELAAEGHRMHPSQSSESEGPNAELVFGDPQSLDGIGTPSLDTERGVVYLVSTFDSILVVREVDWRAGVVRRRIAIQLGRKAEHVETAILGGIVHVVVARGRTDGLVVRIESRSARLALLDARPLRGRAGRAIDVSNAAFTRSRVVCVREEIDARETLSYDLESLALRSVGREALTIATMANGDALEVVAVPFRGGPVFATDDNGSRRTLMRLTPEVSMMSPVGVGSGRAYTSLGDETSDEPSRLVRIEGGAVVATNVVFADHTPGARACLAYSAPDRQLVFTFPRRDATEVHLVDVDTETCVTQGRFAGDSDLYVDVARHHVLIASRRDGAFVLETPAVAGSRDDDSERVFIPKAGLAGSGAFDCSPLGIGRRDPSLVEHLRANDAQTRAMSLRDVRTAVRTALAMDVGDALELATRACDLHPDDTTLAVGRIDALLLADRCSEAYAAAKAMLGDATEVRRHLGHLGLLAATKIGADGTAFAAAIASSPSDAFYACACDALLALHEPSRDAPLDREVRRLAELVSDAARAASSGDDARVRALLLDPTLLALADVQSLGRLVASFVAKPPEEPWLAMLALEVMGRFRDAFDRCTLGSRVELPFADGRLSFEALRSLSDQAEWAIDAFFLASNR